MSKSKRKVPETIGEQLYWTYSNLAMAHAAVSGNSTQFEALHFMIRARLYKGLLDGRMKLGSLLDDEKVKLNAPRGCCYCGADTTLTVDHLIPKSLGGAESADNTVWACRKCNSSKNARDVFEWWQLAHPDVFPPLLLIRRYLKLAVRYCTEMGLMAVPLDAAPPLPFRLKSIPEDYPDPRGLCLWATLPRTIPSLQDCVQAEHASVSSQRSEDAEISREE